MPRAVSNALQKAGYVALDVRDKGLRGKTDQLIYDQSLREQCIIVSADLDFANPLKFLIEPHAGIFVLRVPDDWNAKLRADRIVQALTELDLNQIEVPL